MKAITIFLSLMLISSVAIPQSCLPEGIRFSEQSQIDGFSVNYAGCNEILGDVVITGSINSLSGLSVLNHIGGKLDINLANGLTSLTGLNNLTSIGGDLIISTNSYLESLSGLESVTQINGDLIIWSDSSLVSLNGLENIAPSSIYNLAVYDNYILSECGMQSICAYLLNPNGVVDIYNNGGGCNSPSEIADQCDISAPCLPFGNYYLVSQSDIDDFQVNYPDCSNLQGLVWISGGDIDNLLGLASIVSVGGNLNIIDNAMLSSLSGLENLSSVGGALFIHNNQSLSDLSGLQGLITVGEGLYINYNDYLTSIGQLLNLSAINGYLYISENITLTGLTGLDNVDPGSISGVIITYNDVLSECDVQSICEYLADPSGDVTIWDNDTGCDSPYEILEICKVGINGPHNISFQISVYPNPAIDVINIESAEKIQSVTIFDCRGITIEQWNNGTMDQTNERSGDQAIGHLVELPVDGLAPGLYLVRVVTARGVVTRKVVVGR